MTIDPFDDDAPIGRVLTRREVLALMGAAAGSAFLAACVPSVLSSPGTATVSPAESAVLPACVVRPELTEGPYFVDERLNRSDITPDPSTGKVSAGAPLALAFAVSRVSGSSCTPLQGALVDVWHCNALGVYSDVQDPSGSTVGQQFLRGYQVTDASGAAAFSTIYPGWYSGRAVHIHFKIRTDPDAGSGLEFTSQLFFDDELSDTVYANDPYASKGSHDTSNADDGIYRESNGQTLLSVTPSGGAFEATFQIGVVV